MSRADDSSPENSENSTSGPGDSRDEGEWKEVDRRTLTTSAAPRDAWDAWARPERIRQWFPDDARGKPEPGEEIVHVWSSFGGMEMAHRVLEAEPGRRLLVEADSPTGFPFRQEIRIERSDDGSTTIDLVHYGFDPDADWDDEYEGIDSGWQLALATLSYYLEEHFGEDRTVFFGMRPVPVAPEELQPLFRRENGLARWLTRTGSLEGKRVGDPVRLELTDGIPFTGTLLADSGRELALGWDEIDGVLELKAFSIGSGAWAAALRCSAWGRNQGAEVPHRSLLEAALDRLAETVSG